MNKYGWIMGDCDKCGKKDTQVCNIDTKKYKNVCRECIQESIDKSVAKYDKQQ